MRITWTPELIESELKKVADGLGRMPSNGELISMGLGGLSGQIQKSGGFVVWREKLNLAAIRPCSMWTDELFKSRIHDAVLKYGRLPSAPIMQREGLGDLCSEIGRRGGMLRIAKEMGLEREHSDSDTGWDGEVELSEILSAQGFEVTRPTGVKSPHDLCVDDCVRLDVKSAKYAVYGASRGWFYRIGKTPQADIVALFQLDTKDCFYLPWTICPTTNISLSVTGGKYAAFKNRTDVLRLIIESRKDESLLWPTIGQKVEENSNGSPQLLASLKKK
jgi:hypothetical protein